MIDTELNRGHIDTIREVFVYAQRFRDLSFVVKLDSALFSGDALNALMADIEVLRRAGIKVLIVPGARRRIDEVLSRYGVDSDHVAGLRVSHGAAMPLIQMAAFDVANQVMTLLSARNMYGVVGNWVRARGVGVDDGVDYGHTGVVDRVHREAVERLLEADFVPVFPCIGWSATGSPYNISSDELAVACARSIGAEKLFFVTNGYSDIESSLTVPDDVVREEDGRIGRLTVEQAQRVRDMSQAESQQIAVRRLELAISACRSGVRRVHIVDGRSDGVLLSEIFSNLGAGTMVHSNEYESVRPMHSDDIAAVIRLLRPFVEKGQIRSRSEKEIRSRLEDFAVSEVDGTVRACCALHGIGQRQGEIAALAVDKRFASLGIGEKLVQYQLVKAKSRGLRSVFALTTRASDWFEQLGFVRAAVADLPEERRSSYDTERKPRVLVHTLENV